MKVLAVVGAVVLLTSMSVVACTGDDPVLNRNNGDDAGSDAGIGDAGTVVVGGVLARGDFETTNCLGWTSNGATLDSDPVAHDGKFSCRVCDPSNGTASPVWGVFQDVPSVAAGTYGAQAFVRASGDKGPFEVWLGVQALDGAGQETGSAIERKQIIAPGESWAAVTAKLGVDPGQGATIQILSRTGGGCFLVDDVTLVQE